ncbi:hypothetical protein V6B08_04675 [Ferrovibrio sp. MS7]|uniref:hypothetical protein n=1 Tax=Ferrovibrio plantarum TaxID=3119164 RepID=UPI00313670A6
MFLPDSPPDCLDGPAPGLPLRRPPGQTGTPVAAQPITLAVIVFADQTGLWWLRWLRPGFRHCYAFYRHSAGWLRLDPLSHRLDLDFRPGSGDATLDALDLAARLRLEGRLALTVPVRPAPPRLAPPLPFSCVEAVKRLLGIHSWSVCTPWQLFLFLRKYSLDGYLILHYTVDRQEQNAYIASRWRAFQAWIGREERTAMGGIFSSPNPPAPVMTPPAEDPAEAAAQAARDRRRRAQGETIATSYRGVTETLVPPQRKSLIGE